MQLAQTNTTDTTLKLTDAPMPQVGPGEVIVEIAASYVAPFLSDLIAPNTAFITPKRPFAPGMDAVGRVVEIGEGASHVAVGDMVFADCLVEDNWDGQTGEAAFAGNFAVSAEADGLLERWTNGTFASHIHLPAANVTAVTPALDHAPATSLCRLGWLGTAFGAFRNGGFEPGMHVAIIGASGQVGSSAVLIALALGAGRITAIGRTPARLAPLDQLSETIDLSDEVPLGCDLVIVASDGDCAPMIETAVARVRRKGTVVLVASPERPPQAAGLVTREVGLRGSFWFAPSAVGEMVDMIAQGALDLSALTAHPFTLNKVNDALRAARDMPALHHAALVP